MNPSQEPAHPHEPTAAAPLSGPGEPAPPSTEANGAAGTPAGPEGYGPEGYGPVYPAGAGGYEGFADGGWRGRLAQRSARRPVRRTMLVTAAVLLVTVLLGGPLGLLWAWLAPDVPVIDAGQNGIVINDPSPEEFIAADGWFTLLGLGFGVVVAIVAWMALRRDRGPFLLFGVVAGALGAGYLVAPWIGEMIGQSAYDRWQEAATQGATYLAPPEVHSLGPKLVPAFAAAVVLTLLAGWSNDPDLEAPGARPGYGPNAAYPPPYPPYAPWPAGSGPDGAQPDFHQPGVHEPGLHQPGLHQPGLPQPDASRPDAAEPTNPAAAPEASSEPRG